MTTKGKNVKKINNKKQVYITVKTKPKLCYYVMKLAEYGELYSFIEHSDRFDEQVDRLRSVRFGTFKYIRNFNPEISNALPVSYREQMPMMKHLNKLWDANELEDNASLWFKTPKPNEELYNLENDPYELKNLVSKVELQDTLAFLRKRLDRWIIETEDLGEFPEIELIKK